MIKPSIMDSMATSDSPYHLLLQAVLLIPVSHYLLGASILALVYVYNFLEIHVLSDLFTGFRGQPVSLAFNPSSHVYQHVATKCQILHSRFSSTPWLCSPHLQTAFLSFFGRSPVTKYRRELLKLADGGTLALDWLILNDDARVKDAILGDIHNPIVIIIPGLTSDSDSSYVRHLAFKLGDRGWNVVVGNHRGLGGIPITSDCFYNAGWTNDIRKVVDHIHHQHPKAPLYTVGTSIGANMLVKYLGEEGINAPIAGSAAICCPWDPLLCDRFISRKLVQKLYSKVLALGLKGYANLHQTVLTRIADWEGITKSRTLRDFDTSATRIVAKCETVDTYYRRCCSALYVGNVMVPLLCISALDDPICTKEAIPWDECRGNKNVVLAVTQHGGHLAYFEGMSAKSLWWVRAVDEFLSVLHSSPLSRMKKENQMQVPCSIGLEESLRIDTAPYVNVAKDGTVAGIGNVPLTNGKFEDKVCVTEDNCKDGNDIGMVPVRRRTSSNSTSGNTGGQK